MHVFRIFGLEDLKNVVALRAIISKYFSNVKFNLSHFNLNQIIKKKKITYLYAL